MAHRVFISFKTEDKSYKNYILNNLGVDMIDKSLNVAIDSEDEDHVMKKIREENLSDSTVTIFLIGSNSAEVKGKEEQKFIKRELQASLYNGKSNSRNGLLGVVLPEMYETVFNGSYYCTTCGKSHEKVSINDNTVIKEFSCNFFIEPLTAYKCGWAEEDRYCVLVKWDDFKKDAESAEKYIDLAFDKRKEPIANNVIVYPK